ncbi:NirD/YgiW/YdeI family stress tolerance protein [Polycyclovorans algicola]|uniref:NirD/YgiW/YdeI family stress tolerance protein n=1 Tax=Polycyclovorans algicola TaxID=616992 RepID=UPI0004A6BD48|nr:NirD/YgiW/YdeI family stress tolerance protein [Polycyclovorans algicola]
MNPISRIALPLLVASGTLLVAAGAHAQYTGPSDQPTINTVKDVLDNGRDDMDVQLTGRITKQLGDEDYLFADDTGEIQVEIDDDDMPAQPISETTPVTLYGEIDTKRLRDNEIDVDRITVNTAQ